jgi:hypothetical protein
VSLWAFFSQQAVTAVDNFSAVLKITSSAFSQARLPPYIMELREGKVDFKDN